MAIQTMNTVAARIGKVRGEMLKNAILSEVLCKGGLQKKLEKNSSDTVVYRRALPPSGIDNIWINGANVDTFENGYKITEGVTPAARTLNYVNVTSVVEQYGVLYAITDKAYDLYEDDITSDVKQQIGETVGAIREMICYGALKGSTNKFFAGGTTRGTVSQEISLNTLRKVALSLNASHAKRITGVLSSSGDYGVTSVEPATSSMRQLTWLQQSATCQASSTQQITAVAI